MKIQNNNKLPSQANYLKKSKPFDNSFMHLLKEHTASELTDQSNNLQSHHISSTRRIDGARQMMFSNVNPVKFVGLKELINDAVSDTGTQILQEIESLCNDETGENIDMKLLDNLLELYKETR